MKEDKKFQDQMQRVEELIGTIEASDESPVKNAALELVQTLMDFHSAGIERMMDKTANTGAAGFSIFDDFAKDNLVSSLLLLYDLHPLDIGTRIDRAIEKVRPSLSLHEGDVEVLSVMDGVVTLRLKGSCDGCPSSALTLKNTIEEAIYAAAPDVKAIEVENAAEASEKTDANGFVQIGRPGAGKYTDCEIAIAA